VTFDALPGWRAADSRAALMAFQRSCLTLLQLPPKRFMGGVGYAGNVGDWRSSCAAAERLGRGGTAAREWFEAWFVPFSAGAGPDRRALFTGYYEPDIQASRTQHGAYGVPIYGLPRDLVTADLGLFRGNLAGIRVSGRVEDQRLVPFPARETIDATGLSDAPVLLYAKDAVDVFFLQIQGSGRAHLDDGTQLRLGYAGQNGRPYTPIGRTLLRERAVDREHLSMQSIRAWLESHPSAAMHTMESDESYVFFRTLPLGDPKVGSPGSEGVPLTPEASIAVDADTHALGVPMFVSAKAPSADLTDGVAPFNRLCVAQDTGGAIKGDLRADIFWGYGKQAGAIAGRMKSAGALYVLLPKILAVRVAQKYSGRWP